MQEPFDLTTVIFALIAAFVVWKLRSVLGARTGNEPPRQDRSAPDKPFDANAGKVIKLPGAANDAGPSARASSPDSETKWVPYASMGSSVWKGLNEIESADPAFNPREFLEGAKAAYEMIVEAFAAGDRDGLGTLLAKDVYESFVGAIAERDARGEKVETTFVSIDKAEFVDVTVRGADAQIALRFQSKLISATRNASGVVIEGNPDKVVDMVDLWTFARDLKSRDPNWRLVATETGH